MRSTAACEQAHRLKSFWSWGGRAGNLSAEIQLRDGGQHGVRIIALQIAQHDDGKVIARKDSQRCEFSQLMSTRDFVRGSAERGILMPSPSDFQ
jgi:hypothetical protein